MAIPNRIDRPGRQLTFRQSCSSARAVVQHSSLLFPHLEPASVGREEMSIGSGKSVSPIMTQMR